MLYFQTVCAAESNVVMLSNCMFCSRDKRIFWNMLRMRPWRIWSRSIMQLFHVDWTNQALKTLRPRSHVGAWKSSLRKPVMKTETKGPPHHCRATTLDQSPSTLRSLRRVSGISKHSWNTRLHSVTAVNVCSNPCVKANKLLNKKFYPWPKYAVFVRKTSESHCEEQCIRSSSRRNRHILCENNLLRWK